MHINNKNEHTTSRTGIVAVSRSRRRSLLYFAVFLGAFIHLSVAMMKVTHIIRDQHHQRVNNNVPVGVGFDFDGSDANMSMLPKRNDEMMKSRSGVERNNDSSSSQAAMLELASASSSSLHNNTNTTTTTFTLDQFLDRSNRITIPDKDRRLAFLHIGKSGGSTISVLLRNGCMTAVDGVPCEPDRWRKIPNQTEETIASQRILFYLHTPHVSDDGNNNNHNHSMAEYYRRITSVVVVARDPLERFVSAFLARHPRNLEVARKRNRQIRAIAEAKGVDPPVWAKPIWGDGDVEMDQLSRAAYLGCFPNVDELASCAAAAADDDDDDPTMRETETSGSRSYSSYRAYYYNTTIYWAKRGIQYSRDVAFHCSETCRDVLTGKNKYIVHVRYNYEAFCKDLPPETEVFVLRTTNLWKDWVHVNNILGAPRDVAVPEKGSDADVLNARGKLPVRNNLSPRGRDILCHFLKNDIKVYIDLLNRAVNLSDDDVRAALKIIHQNCPSVLSSLVK